MRIGTWMAAVLACAGCGGASSGGSTTPTPSAVASASQFVEAIDVAHAGHAEALVFEVEIDDQSHPGFIEVEYWEGTGAHEVFIDPGTMAVVAEGPDTSEPEEQEERATVHAHLRDGRGDLRAAFGAGLLSSHDAAAVQEVELTILEGHYVIAVELLRDGARTTLYHAIDGTYLGTAEETLAHYAALPGQGHD